MKTAIVLLFAILFAGSAFSQERLPEALEIVADTATYIRMPVHKLQYFIEEPGRPLQIGQVSQPEIGAKFKTLDSVSPVVIPAAQNVWLRYRIKNTMSQPLGITIPQGISRADIYISGPSGKWSRYVTGMDVPHTERDGYKRIIEARHTIPAGSEVIVYERDFNKRAGMMLSVAVGIEKNVVSRSYVDNDFYLQGIVWSSVLFGFFIFGAIFNFLFYYTVRERVYLVYGILLIFVAISYMGGTFRDIVLRNFPAHIPYHEFIGFSLTFYLFCIVSIMFLEVSKFYPRVYKLLIACSTAFVVFSILIIIFGIGRTELGVGIINMLRYLLVAGILLIMIADLVKKRYFARIFMLANFPFILVFTMQLITKANLRMLSDFTILWAVTVLSWSLFRRYKSLQAENARQAIEKEQERNALIAQQNEMLEHQVAERTAELTQSLDELKQTQNQLIQSEKMASLGELTAGIAHEIQNPLNFVNNFSDVSVELLQELKEELGKGDIEEASAIADDVVQNLQKINHHGKRADGIVKGMLQHSRTSSGQKEPTDINALADEYFRLAYHGLRAKDKSFNAELITAFAENLPRVPAIPQDIGRVLLNLFTNAFYAVAEKAIQQPEGYKPTVSVTTKVEGGHVIITVRDNGPGISPAIIEKIMQPFFTTKPTGKGTGLGLSLSYDIVKAHNGTLHVESIEGEYTEFTITLGTGNGS